MLHWVISRDTMHKGSSCFTVLGSMPFKTTKLLTHRFLDDLLWVPTHSEDCAWIICVGSLISVGDGKWLCSGTWAGDRRPSYMHV